MRMDVAGIKAYAADRMERVSRLMEEALSSDIALLSEVNASLLSGSGKRLRPLLTLLGAGACGGVTEDTERLAAAVELLHNATLLHDDVVDGARERRGRPTVSSLLNAPAAVLIGDFWLSSAVSLVLQTSCRQSRCLQIFASTLDDLAQGEMLQLEKSVSCDTTYAEYIRIVRCKTASLFETALRCGAISTGASEAAEEALCLYGRNLGIAFQIKDDILDYVGGEIGKPVGQDLAEHKVTLPLLSAMSEMSLAEAGRIRALLCAGGAEQELRTLVLSGDGIGRAQQELEMYIDRACDALSSLPDGTDKDCLISLARYSTARKQ